jgi:2,5-furandicarboxylate decarboxylase 1
MSVDSFRSWVADLADRGDLIEIDEPVSTEYEIAAYIKKSCDEAGPAFRFTNVEGHDLDVVGSLYGAKRRILEAVGVESHAEGMEKYLEIDQNPIEPVVVEDGPVTEIVDTDPDLYDVPIVRHNEHDDGHYITAGISVAKLPHTGVWGQGVYRMPREGPRTLGLFSPA